MFTFHFLLVLLRQLYKFATNMGEGPLFCRIEGEEGELRGKREEVGGKK